MQLLMRSQNPASGGSGPTWMAYRSASSSGCRRSASSAVPPCSAVQNCRYLRGGSRERRQCGVWPEGWVR